MNPSIQGGDVIMAILAENENEALFYQGDPTGYDVPTDPPSFFPAYVVIF